MKSVTETRAPRLLRAALVSLFALFALPSSALADAVPANDTGSFILRLTPNVDMGVTVDTTGSAWQGSADLDTVMDLASEARLGTGVKLTIVGDFNLQELSLQGVALDTWTLDADETPTNDQLRLYALIGADQAAAPAAALFDGAANLVTETAARAGQVQADEGGDLNHAYEFSDSQAPQYADVDDMPVGAVRRLWLRANTPPQSSVDQQQGFVLTVTAMTGAGQ